MKALVVALCFTALVHCASSDVGFDGNDIHNGTVLHNADWVAFKGKHQKTYHSTTLEAKRYKHFLVNQQFIDDHLSKSKNGLVTFKVSMNPFGDMNSAEFVAQRCGYNRTNLNLNIIVRAAVNTATTAKTTKTTTPKTTKTTTPKTTKTTTPKTTKTTTPKTTKTTTPKTTKTTTPKTTKTTTPKTTKTTTPKTTKTTTTKTTTTTTPKTTTTTTPISTTTVTTTTTPTSTTNTTTTTPNTSTTTTTSKTTTTTVTNSPAAPTLNWTAQGYVTPVKDQGQCGSCWAFSSTGALEGQYFKKTGQLVSLSEQNLVDCVSSNLGCNGGAMQYAFNYVKSNNGIATEANYPYTATQGTCKYVNSMGSGVLVKSYVQLQIDESVLGTTLETVGPLTVAIDASHMSFQFYSSGIYNEPACSSTNLDHAVLLVGYGTENGQDYWLLKNSWGTSWGENGYFKLPRNKNNACGIASDALYPLLA